MNPVGCFPSLSGPGFVAFSMSYIHWGVAGAVTCTLNGLVFAKLEFQYKKPVRKTSGFRSQGSNQI